MKSTAILVALVGTLAIGATELPIDDVAKLGVSGACIGLVWWMIARTLPGIVQVHADTLQSLTAAYRQSVADLRELHHETTENLSSHLDGVKQVISEAAKTEAALLRELIRDMDK